MDMNLIAIKVDPGTALTTLDQAHAKLQQAEIAGQKAAKAMTGVSSAAKSIGQAAAEEQAALSRATAATEQYAKELAKVNQAQATSASLAKSGGARPTVFRERGLLDPSTFAIAGSRLGGAGGGALGNVVSGLATGGIIGAAIAGVDSLVGAFDNLGEAAKRDAAQMVEFKDHLTDLRNEAQKFTDAGHTSNQVIAEQAALAHDLHAKLADTIPVYDAVNDSARGLNLTHAEQIRLVRSLGEDLQSNNKPLSEAGSVMDTLATAVKNGKLSTEQFEAIARQVPGVVQEWEKHFGLSEQALEKAATTGKIAIRSLVDVTAQGGQSIDAEWTKRVRTVAQYRTELEEAYKRELAQSGDTSIAGKYEAMRKAIAAAGTEGVDNAERLKDAQNVLGDSFKGAAANAFQMQLAVDVNSGALDKQNESATTLSQTFARLSDDILKLTAREAETKKQFDDVTDAIRGGTIVLQTWQAALASQKVAGDPMLKFMNDFAAQQKQTAADVDGLNRAFKAGGISWDYYRAHIEALKTPAQRAAEEMARLREEAENEANILALQRDFNPAFGGNQAIDAAQKAADDFKALAESSKEAIEKDNEAARQHAAELAKIPGLYDQWESTAHDALSGLDSGWKQIVSDATDSGKHIRDAMTGAFTDIQSALFSMVQKGKLDLSSLGGELLDIAAKLAIREGTGGLLGLIGGGMTGFDYTAGISRMQFPGFATGGDMVVGGAGGPDTKTAIFRVTPGETIRVRTPQQMAAEQAAGSGGTTIVNSFNYDPRAFKSMIHTEAMNMIRQNPQAVRALLGN